MTGLANSGNCEINRQRMSSNIIPSAEESHRPKMNSEVKRSVVMGYWLKVSLYYISARRLLFVLIKVYLGLFYHLNNFHWTF